MKKLKFAVISCDRIAQRHAEHIQNNGILKAVCDIEIFSFSDGHSKCFCIILT